MSLRSRRKHLALGKRGETKWSGAQPWVTLEKRDQARFSGRKNSSLHPELCSSAGSSLLAIVATILFALLFQTSAAAQTKRVVVIKIDGLPYELVERFAREPDPLTGKSRLPWFDNVFFKNGTRVTNFYVRGMSLSAPSWSTLDTGQHLQIKGNVEFDRDILHTYDYLNFIPFYFKQAIKQIVIGHAGIGRKERPNGDKSKYVDVP